MSCSILLLLVLQFYWIKSEYKSAENAFRRETNLVFRNTVATLMDSLYMSRIDLLESDSLRYKHRRFRRSHFGDSIAFSAIGKALQLDLSGSKLIVTRDSLAKLDTAGDAERPLKSIMIRINPDSLDVQSLKNQYDKNLKALDGKIVFRVLEREPGEVIRTDSPAFMTEFIRIGPPNARQYAASFEGVQLLLFKEILPQILFSILLTIMIGIAFLVMYKNLMTQQRLSMQKDEFINNVSHELKTPIATVNVALEAFRNFNVLDNPKVTHEYLDIVKTELDRLSLMTERILNTSVYENIGIEVDNEVFDFKDTVNQSVKGMNLSSQDKLATVETVFHGSDFKLKGSKMHLTNLVYNLLDNAINHGRSQTPVRVTLTEESRHLVLEVKDFGMGIPREYKHKIFEKFFRVPHGDVHNVKGYGLGLSYVKQVVKAHQGTIEVESEPGKGSAFTIKLPKNG
ncbi:Two-component system sensor histidine kinase [Fulvivirga imtechensis AK7]|uniref:histidine kinase n=1 Tax=Fulvivirga imtechensis AK7 TaxID=1237149 RepID=L8JM05_9BACT|nr:HAMP domain-containing sensor histidine kinase [Fulvivirga imtechensis]ELR68564.1 Two-component system sensor histidine kinase [Fulvivirga imtechensis AK7]